MTQEIYIIDDDESSLPIFKELFKDGPCNMEIKYIEVEVKHFVPKLQEQNLVLNLKHLKCINVSKKKVLN